MQLDIGRGHIQLTPQLLAINDPPADGIRAAEQSSGQRKIAILKRLAYAGTAHPGTIDGQSTTITDGKPQLRAQFAQQGKITDAITAKPEVDRKSTRLNSSHVAISYA